MGHLSQRRLDTPLAAVITVLIKAYQTNLQHVLKLIFTSVCPSQFSSEGANGEGEVPPSPSLWDDVALLPEQAQQQVLGVLGPAVDPGALEPVGDMSLEDRHRVS